MLTQTADLDQLRDVKEGDTLNLRFTEQAAPDLAVLIGMHYSDVIEIDAVDLLLVEDVTDSGSFENLPDRKLSIIAGQKWSYDSFTQRMQRALEDIEVRCN